MIKLFKIMISITSLIVALTLIGCSISTNHTSMTTGMVETIKKNPKFKEAITVGTIVGGKQHLSLLQMGGAEVTSESFKKALESSLSANGYLAKTPKTAKYKLDATMLSLYVQQPEYYIKEDGYHGGHKQQASIEIQYALSNISSGKVNYYPLTSFGLTTDSETVFLFEHSTKVAAECAARNNIIGLLLLLYSIK